MNATGAGPLTGTVPHQWLIIDHGDFTRQRVSLSP